MAFDAASVDTGGGVGQPDGMLSDPLTSLSQRIATLVQVTSQLTSLSGGLGGSGDVAALRQRIENNETLGVRLQGEVTTGIRDARNHVQTTSSALKLSRLEAQFHETRSKFASVVEASRTKRASVGVRVETGAGAAARVGPSIRRIEASNGQVVIEWHGTGSVDAAIAEVSL